MSTRSLRWTRRRRRDDAGSSAVEFALVATPLLILLIGIIQFSIYFWSFQAGSHAVRESARRFAVSANCTTMDSYVSDQVGSAAVGALTVNDQTVINGPGKDPTETEIGDLIRVAVEYNALDLNFFPFDFTVKESATARIEHLPDPAVTCS